MGWCLSVNQATSAILASSSSEGTWMAGEVVKKTVVVVVVEANTVTGMVVTAKYGVILQTTMRDISVVLHFALVIIAKFKED